MPAMAIQAAQNAVLSVLVRDLGNLAEGRTAIAFYKNGQPNEILRIQNSYGGRQTCCLLLSRVSRVVPNEHWVACLFLHVYIQKMWEKSNPDR